MPDKNVKWLDITSTHKCSYTIGGKCIHTMNRAIASRLRKPLSNCLSSKVTFNVCSKLLWVKYKIFLPKKVMRRNSIISFCSFQHNLLSFATNTESIKNILYMPLKALIVCLKDDMLNYNIFIGRKQSGSKILIRYIIYYRIILP